MEMATAVFGSFQAKMIDTIFGEIELNWFGLSVGEEGYPAITHNYNVSIVDTEMYFLIVENGLSVDIFIANAKIDVAREADDK